jgi:hypothetical protein
MTQGYSDERGLASDHPASLGDVSAHWHAVPVASAAGGSVPIADVLAAIDAAVAAGRDDVVLTGPDVAGWGADLGLGAADLLRAVVAHPAEALYAIDGFGSAWLLARLDAVLPLLASGRFSWINVRIGPDGDVPGVVARLRGAAPELMLRADLAFGSAGESQADFERTLAISRAFDAPSFHRAAPPTHDAIDARERAAVAEYGARVAGGPIRVRHHRANPVLDGHEAWRQKTNAVFARRIGVGLAIGEGWSVRGSRVDRGLRAVVLDVGHVDGRSFALALAHPQRPGDWLAVTRRFALWVPDADGLRDEDAQRALARLRHALTAG